MPISKIIYLLIVIVGFSSFYFSILLINRRYKKFNYYECFDLYYISMLFFLVFSKITHIIIDCDTKNLKYLFSSKYFEVLKFVFSGYSFIGGYIGVIISIFVISRIYKFKKIDIATLFIPSILIMYSILKIGCYVNGCCYGKIDIPVQLIETFANLISFIIVVRIQNKDKLIGAGLISFGGCRFIISLFRVFKTVYTLIFIEVFCLLLVLSGIRILKKK